MHDGKKLYGVGEGGMVHQNVVEDQAVIVAADKSAAERGKSHNDGREKDSQNEDGGAVSERSWGVAVTGHVDRQKPRFVRGQQSKRRRASRQCHAGRGKL